MGHTQRIYVPSKRDRQGNWNINQIQARPKHSRANVKSPCSVPSFWDFLPRGVRAGLPTAWEGSLHASPPQLHTCPRGCCPRLRTGTHGFPKPACHSAVTLPSWALGISVTPTTQDSTGLPGSPLSACGSHHRPPNTTFCAPEHQQLVEAAVRWTTRTSPTWAHRSTSPRASRARHGEGN